MKKKNLKRKEKKTMKKNTHRLPYEAFFHYMDKMSLIEQVYAAKR